MPRIIGHLDMDAFFAAVEERDNPRWAGMPIVVGADPNDGRGRGVVSTANYKAREYGIRSALPITTAWRLSEAARAAGKPAAVFLPVSGRRYGEVSRVVMEIVSRYATVVEQASVDEAYFDLSHHRTWANARAVCARIKRDITKAERLTCSIGLGPNKLVAKVASDFKKPDGLTVVTAHRAAAFLAPLNIRKLPGVGPKTEELLKRRGISTVAAIQVLTEADLWQLLGEWGLDLYEKARGIGSEELVTEWTAKSIGQEETFDQDTLDASRIGECVAGMCQEIVRTLKHDGFASFRRVVLKVRFADFTTVTRSRTLVKSAISADVLRTEGLRMLLPFLDRRENPKHQSLRLVGIRVEELS
jgi:DNA polymerase IV (DinB-like DNA polymerase)